MRNAIRGILCAFFVACSVSSVYAQMWVLPKFEASCVDPAFILDGDSYITDEKSELVTEPVPVSPGIMYDSDPHGVTFHVSCGSLAHTYTVTDTRTPCAIGWKAKITNQESQKTLNLCVAMDLFAALIPMDVSEGEVVFSAGESASGQVVFSN